MLIAIVATATNSPAVNFDDDITFFKASFLGSAIFADFCHIKAANIVGELKPIAKVGVNGAGDGNAEGGEAYVFTISGIRDEGMDYLRSDDVYDLILCIIAA